MKALTWVHADGTRGWFVDTFYEGHLDERFRHLVQIPELKAEMVEIEEPTLSRETRDERATQPDPCCCVLDFGPNHGDTTGCPVHGSEPYRDELPTLPDGQPLPEAP